jgi:Fe-S-cluster containining protein
MPILPLSRPYHSRHGVPVLTEFDTNMFSLRYFARCMSCTFCQDQCCTYGVDVDVDNVERILAVAEELEVFTETRRETWFTGEVTSDPEFPGNGYTRTAVNGSRCVFLDQVSRGCKLHRFCDASGRDYHDLKPMVSTLFPLTFDEGLLHASDEAVDGSLACVGPGPSVYEGGRDELRYYFGDALVAELDTHSASSL